MTTTRNFTLSTHVDLERNRVAVEWIPDSAEEDWHGPLARAIVVLNDDDERYAVIGAEMPGDVEADALDAIGYARIFGRTSHDQDLASWMERAS